MASVKSASFLAAVGAVSLLTGCTSMEQKLGRGISNVMEPLRGGELTRSTEQTYLADGPIAARSYGVVHGVARTIQRTAVGAFDIVTFPIPTDPLITPSEPVYPDSVKPQMAGNMGVFSSRHVGIDNGAVLPGLGTAMFDPLEN